MTRRKRRVKLGKTEYCYYCNYSSDALEDVMLHEEKNHGCFRTEVSRASTYHQYKHKDYVWVPREPKQEDLEIDELGIYEPLVWINEDEGRIATLRYFVKCNGCKKTMSIITSPDARRNELMDRPLTLCPECNMSMYRDETEEDDEEVKVEA